MVILIDGLIAVTKTGGNSKALVIDQKNNNLFRVLWETPNGKQEIVSDFLKLSDAMRAFADLLDHSEME